MIHRLRTVRMVPVPEGRQARLYPTVDAFRTDRPAEVFTGDAAAVAGELTRHGIA